MKSEKQVVDDCYKKMVKVQYSGKSFSLKGVIKIIKEGIAKGGNV